jgi:hypothetical protein
MMHVHLHRNTLSAFFWGAAFFTKGFRFSSCPLLLPFETAAELVDFWSRPERLGAASTGEPPSGADFLFGIVKLSVC